MLKLIKYELIKQFKSKVIMFAILALLEVQFFYGMFAEKDSVLQVFVVLFCLAMYSIYFYLYIESIITFSKDMKTKNSYMLFMTPNSSFTIVAAKVITSFIQILVFVALTVAIVCIDMNVLFHMKEGTQDAYEFVRRMLSFKGVDITVGSVVLWIATLLSQYLLFLGLAFLSITSTSTFLSNNRFKGFFSALIFVVVYVCINLFAGKILEGVETATSQSIIWICLSLGISFLIYAVTSWLLEKKVSL